ncbi:hypothetical protein XENOCAPTIV_013523, partial [Xenoophorus captivus]
MPVRSWLQHDAAEGSQWPHAPTGSPQHAASGCAWAHSHHLTATRRGAPGPGTGGVWKADQIMGEDKSGIGLEEEEHEDHRVAQRQPLRSVV